MGFPPFIALIKDFGIENWRIWVDIGALKAYVGRLLMTTLHIAFVAMRRNGYHQITRRYNLPIPSQQLNSTPTKSPRFDKAMTFENSD